MGKRANRKKTRNNKEEPVRAEIRAGLKGGERFRDIAAAASMRHQVGPDRALGMVIEEYAQGIRHDEKGEFGARKTADESALTPLGLSAQVSAQARKRAKNGN